MLVQVLLAIAEEAPRRRLRRLLRTEDVLVEIIRGRKNLAKRAFAKSGDVLLIDDLSAAAITAEGIKPGETPPAFPAVVVVTESESPAEHAEMIAGGLTAVLHLGLSDEELMEALRAIFGRRSELAKIAVAHKPLATPALSDFVSESPVMEEFMELVRCVVQADTSLLILGETGVGKERLARAVHAESARGGGPFIAVNCGALPEALLESELFGHEEGAFTGATRTRKGAFELAHGGTIFLDEVGDMPHHLQVKLLRVLQDHEVQRVGAEKAFQVDVRVMAASNRDVESDVEAKVFRRDLYYRLSVVTLSIPPLRERKEDIGVLAKSYVEYYGPRIGRNVDTISEDTIDALRRHSWPGNVRELMNVIERAMLLCKDSQISLADLPAIIAGSLPGTGETVAIPRSPEELPAEWLTKPLAELRDSLVADLERSYLGAMLNATGGKVGETARRAGIEPRSLYAKMKAHGLTKEDFKPTRRE